MVEGYARDFLNSGPQHMKFLSIKSLTGGSAAAAAASFVLLVLMWHLSTPASSGPIGILFVFILIYIFFTALVLVLMGLWSFMMQRLADRPRISDRRRYYVSSVLGFLPVLYITLLSMGGASFWGIALIVLFTGLMLFYVLRRSA